MDISKHKVLQDIYEVTQLVEELGCSTELTSIVVALSEIGEQTEKIVDAVKRKNAMEITLGEDGVVMTWQNPFPKTAQCDCGCDARIAFVAHEGFSGRDDLKRVCEMHDNEDGNMWLHDSCAVAVYFCPTCLAVTSKYNQA